jgi:hypothetical protein
MDPGPLVTEQIDAGTRLLAELEKTMAVTAAFWLKRPDQDSWYFYVAPEPSRDDSRGVVGGEVLRVALAMQDPNLSYLQVRPADPDDPLARAVLDYQRLYPGKAVRLRDRAFGGMGIDEIYIYPSPIAVG